MDRQSWCRGTTSRSTRTNCASCHGDDLKGSADRAVARRRRRASHARDELAQMIRQGTGRMPAFADGARQQRGERLVNFLITGQRRRRHERRPIPTISSTAAPASSIFLDPDGYPAITPPWGTLNAIDLNKGEIRWTIPFGEYPKLAAQGLTNTGTRQLRRRDRHGERAVDHRRDDVRQQVPRVRQAHRQAAVGDDAAGGGERDAVHVHGERATVHRDRVRRREERRTVRRDVRGVRASREVTGRAFGFA